MLKGGVSVDSDKEGLVKKLQNTSVIEFRCKDKIYSLNTVISMSYLEFFQENKNKLSQKELAIEFIVMNNRSFKIIIKELTRREIFYIINKFLRKNNISKKKVNSYSDFYKVMDEYIICCNEKFSQQVKQMKESIYINIRPLIEWKKQINLLMKPSIEFLNKVKFSISDNISQRIQELLQPIRDIANEFEKIGISISKLNKLLIELGYPLLDIELSDINTIIENEDSEGIYEIIDNVIVRNYTDEVIGEILETWKNYKFLKTRIRFFEDAIYAHKIGKY